MWIFIFIKILLSVYLPNPSTGIAAGLNSEITFFYTKIRISYIIFFYTEIKLKELYTFIQN